MKKAVLTVIVLGLLLPTISPFAKAANVTLNATVPASSSDFSASIQALNAGSDVPQGTTLNYEITYGSSLSSATNLTVEASWSKGTINGDSSPSVNIVDYVIGSASDAYNNTTPVVDTINRTITWNIASFPDNTSGQTVTFSLKTNDAYTGPNNVSFTVSGRVLGPGTTTAYSSVTQTYLYDISLAPTPTPTSTPTPLPTNTPTPIPGSSTSPLATPTPTNSPQPTTLAPAFSHISIRTISQQDATIAVTTSAPTTLELLYGTSPTFFAFSQRAATSQKTHLITLPNLSPDTKYYFKVVATDGTSQITSDIFTLTTAERVTAPTATPGSVIVTSDGIILATTSFPSPFSVMLPTHAPYRLRLALTNFENIASIETVIRSTTNSGNEMVKTMNEIKEGEYQSSLTGSSTPGSYDLFVRITDTKGSIREEFVGGVRMVRPFTVLNKRTKEAIEGAKVQLSMWNERERRFVPVTTNILPSLPLVTKPNGSLDLILPPGKYEAEITMLGFDSQTVTFTIGEEKDAGYPEALLEEQPFSLITLISYGITTISEFFFAITKEYIDHLTSSAHFYNILAASSLLTVSLFSLFSLFSRTRLAPGLLPVFLLFHLKPKKHFGSHSLHGVIIDSETNNLLTHANLYVMQDNGKVIADHAVSDRRGRFNLRQIPDGPFEISILKQGYLHSTVHLKSSELEKDVVLALARKEKPVHILKTLWHNLEAFFSFSFEVWLLLSFVLLLIIGMSIGWEKIVGFLAIALFNLTVWSLHRKKVYHSATAYSLEQ